MQEIMTDKKAAILQATLELIAEHGFHGTPMSQIAQRANIGVGTIYRYFSGKEDLINSLYLELKTRISHYVFKNYSDSMPVRDSFVTLLRSIVDYLVAHPMEFHYIEQYSSSPLITAATRQEGLRMFAQGTNLFVRAKQEALFKDLPLEMINALAYGAAISLAGLCLFSENKPDSATLDKGVAAVWDALTK